MSVTLKFSDYGLDDFRGIAANFGHETYAYAVTPNVDHIIRYHDQPAFRDLYASAKFVLLDSRFLAGLLRLTRGLNLRCCPGSDLTATLFADVIAPDDKVVLIGSTSAAVALLTEKYGVRGLRHFNPPMGFIKDPAAVEQCLRFIESESPFRFCLLAVGSPQQEMLAHALLARGRARGLALCIGASIDFLTGNEKRAPRWMQNAGLEWAYRLLQNPMRLARRYLIRGPRIFLMLPKLRIQILPETHESLNPALKPAPELPPG